MEQLKSHGVITGPGDYFWACAQHGTTALRIQTRRRRVKENMLLQIKNLKAGYGDLEVLRDVLIEIHAGEIVALIGPNGAGKSVVSYQ